MTEVKFLGNGQGYFDFEYLLSITNQEFVNEIKNVVEFGEHYSNSPIVSVMENEFEVSVIVGANDFGVVRLLRFSKARKDFEHTVLGILHAEQLYRVFQKAGVTC